MQLARPAPALLLGGVDRLANAALLDPSGGRDRRRRAGGEGLQQRLVLGVAVLAEHDQHPERLATEHERDEKTAGGRQAERIADPARNVPGRGRNHHAPGLAQEDHEPVRLDQGQTAIDDQPRIRSRSISPPTARAIAVVASSRRTVRTSPVVCMHQIFEPIGASAVGVNSGS